MDIDQVTTRFPRFTRDRSRKPPFVLQDRDAALVRVVAQHRFIASDDLKLLVGGSPQVLTRRLQRLFHHGFVDRPRTQLERGNGPMVYGLGQRGAELMARLDGRTVRGNWAEKNRAVRLRHLQHALMLSRFQSALRHAAQASGTVLVEQWVPDGAISTSIHVQHGNGLERIPIRPDGFFMLNALAKTPAHVHCFLEADRSTMTVGRFETKLRGYFHFWKSGEAERTFHIRNFLVITTTTSPERARHLMNACRAIDGRGLRMFLFASERDYLPTSKGAIFDPIWETPADRDLHSLLE